LRFVASASLVALASLVGVLALFPDALEELVVASAETPDSPATGCKQDWLRFDSSCLSRRGMPWIAPSSDSNAIAVPSAGEIAPAPPVTESPSAAAAPAEPGPQSEAAAPQQGTPAPVAEERQSPTSTQRSEAAQQETPAPVAEEQRIEEQRREATAPPPEASPPPPVAAERHIPKQRREVAAPRRETPPVAEGRRAAKPAAEAQPRAPAPKKPASEDRAAKQRPVTEALNAVRRFQDNLHDIPVSAYAADGTRRTIVIRPTSIQDVYYYSAPR
jgi:hypothetical protein